MGLFGFGKTKEEKRTELLDRIRRVLTRIYEVLKLNGKQLDQAIILMRNKYPEDAKHKFVLLLHSLEQLRRIETRERDEERHEELEKFAHEQQVQIKILKKIEREIERIAEGDVNRRNEVHDLLLKLREEIHKEADELEQAA